MAISLSPEDQETTHEWLSYASYIDSYDGQYELYLGEIQARIATHPSSGIRLSINFNPLATYLLFYEEMMYIIEYLNSVEYAFNMRLVDKNKISRRELQRRINSLNRVLSDMERVMKARISVYFTKGTPMQRNSGVEARLILVLTSEVVHAMELSSSNYNDNFVKKLVNNLLDEIARIELIKEHLGIK